MSEAVEQHELRAVAADLRVWQSRQEASQSENKRRFDGLEEDMGEIKQDVKDVKKCNNEIKIDLAKVNTRLAMWSAAGGLGGAGLVSLVIAIVAR